MSAESKRRPKRNKEIATGSFVDSQGAPVDAQGYSIFDYFDWRGRYIGPDCYGVGPTFSGWAGHKLGGSRK